MLVCIPCVIAFIIFIHIISISDGQKIAKRLSVQLNKQMHRIQKLLQNYNEATHENAELSSVLDLQSKFWKGSNSTQIHLKQDIIHNYLLILRSREELILLKQDMLNTLEFFAKKTDVLNKKTNEIKATSTPTVFLVGLQCLLIRYHSKLVMQFLHALATFSQFIDIPGYHQSSTIDTEDNAELSDESDIDCENLDSEGFDSDFSDDQL